MVGLITGKKEQVGVNLFQVVDNIGTRSWIRLELQDKLPTTILFCNRVRVLLLKYCFSPCLTR